MGSEARSCRGMVSMAMQPSASRGSSAFQTGAGAFVRVDTCFPVDVPRTLDVCITAGQGPEVERRLRARVVLRFRVLSPSRAVVTMNFRPLATTVKFLQYACSVSSGEVDWALVQAAEKRAHGLLAASEDQWFERKSIRIKSRDLAPTLVAFANAEGGTIVIGLSGGVVEEVDGRPDQLNELRQCSIQHTDPPVRASCEEVEIVTEEGLNHLLVIRVAPGERVHRTAKGDCYLRVGDESRRLNFAQERELLYDRGQTQYDGEPAADISFDDLDERLLGQFAKNIGLDDHARALQARSLLTLKGQPTNAAYLLFASRPQDLFPQAVVRVIRYLANDRGSGARLNIAEEGDARFEGPIPTVIHQAQEAVERWVPQRRALNTEGRFAAVPLVPRDAWLEGIVNAVVHRSYSLAGDHIRVEIFPNRIEIESPGRFPGLVNLNSPLKIARFARNPRISRVCADLRITQELGEGIRRMFEEMRHAGLDDPLYRQTSGSVRLVLTTNPRLDPKVAASLPRGSTDVLKLLETSDRQLGTGEVAVALGISRPTAVKRLNALRDVNLVDWHGKSARDPRAYWTAASN